ncbi:hypothetical protein SAMN05421872_11257 [Nocardioides lianchengensis]|uniref:Uncharacterized protein n=2 Tax=Nocardioides lianchengensis TaxID=1045774 RepID=A0A1G6YI48_9ACTN|nr:hypothetical protein SAMN05421872_11257 [Nocardioides lianchengensis]
MMLSKPSGPPLLVEFGSDEVARVLEPKDQAQAHWIEATHGNPINLDTLVPGVEEHDYWFEVTLTFKDSGGQNWVRLPDGQLVLA